jgi:dihydrofolate synthase/folylpolyglutamate synthase
MSARSLEQWLGWLEQLHPSEIELGLQRIRDVADRMKLPKPAPKVVTVTGTNGKGSTCAFIAALCRAQGLRVGVYSSPHFLRYNERIQIEGEAVSDELLCEAFSAIEAVRGKTSLTYFEMGTLAAFWVFTRSNLDVAVLEVGLGGRLDAVNIVDPDVAVVTGVALDHADWLGQTREDVAREKAGIFRAGVPAVCGDPEPPQSLLEHAAGLPSPLYLRGVQFDLAQAGGSWSWRGQGSTGAALNLDGMPLPGLPVQNAAVALQAVSLLGLPLNAAEAGAVLQQAALPGRLQQIQLPYDNGLRHLVLDVAHNPQAAAYVADWLRQRPLAGKRYAVFGALADKDVDGVLLAMQGVFECWHIAPLPSPRSFPLGELQQHLQQAGEQHVAHASIHEALQACLSQSAVEDEILIFGSFFTVAQVLEYLQA